jgi:hypothetical protein
LRWWWSGRMGRRVCGISIQERIRERLFYKDGQIEPRRRSAPFERAARGQGRGGRGLVPSRAVPLEWLSSNGGGGGGGGGVQRAT